MSMLPTNPIIRFDTISPSTVIRPGLKEPYDPVGQTIGSGGDPILVGVGGACHGHADLADMVFDHRFERFAKPYPDNFPSCSLLVIYHAPVIADWARNHRHLPEWLLLTRHEPGFDACLGVYLVRRILEEPDLALGWAARNPKEEALIPAPAFWSTGSRVQPVFRWRQAEIPLLDRNPLDPVRRTLLQLALVASHVEKNEPMAAPPDRAAHHLFLASRLRKRFTGPDATSFFRILEAKGVRGDYQPLIDGIADDDPDFAPEIRLLDRQRELYRTDLRKARRAIVFLAQKEDRSRPGADAAGGHRLDPGQKAPTAQGQEETRIPVDGLFLRDPQCLLFRWFARADRESSGLGRGYSFLGLAQSFARRADNPNPNRSRYRFFLDADWARSHQVHLLDVWALLQQRELELLGRDSPKPGNGSTEGSKTAFSWGKGADRSGASIESPIFGTRMAEGTRPDLSDDEAGYAVWNHLTLQGFAEGAAKNDLFAWEVGDGISQRNTAPLGDKAMEGGFRFVSIHRSRFATQPSLPRDPIDAQIAERLWESIQPLGTRGIPDDFAQRHLIHRGEWVAVWNRQGIAIAHSDIPATNLWVERLRQEVRELARLTGEIRSLLHDEPQAEGSAFESVERKLHRGTEALALLAELHLRAQAGQSPILRPFMEANGIMELASMVESMNRIRIQEKVEAQERRRDDRLQQTVAVASGIAILLAWFQMERIALLGGEGAFGLIEGNPRAWIEAVGGGLVVALFLVWAFRRIKR